MKEIKISLAIGESDLTRKKTQMDKFLADKEQVKISLRLKGRERLHPERGVDKVKGLISHLAKNKTNGEPKVTGNNISVVAFP